MPTMSQFPWTHDTLRALHWNTLAPTLCSPPEWGGFDGADPAILNWPARREAIVELISVDMPDIACLVEFEDPRDQIVSRARVGNMKAAMSIMGYDHQTATKTGKHADGCAIFWDRNRHNLQQTIVVEYELASQIALIVVLDRCIVATTHLKAKPGNEAVRSQSVTQLLSALTCVCKDYPGLPVLLTGDMNAEPNEDCIAQIKAHPLGFVSAYPEESYTTWKIRDTEVKRCIDYVFSTPGLTPFRHTLPPPDATARWFPSIHCPSDHLPLMVDFTVPFTQTAQ